MCKSVCTLFAARVVANHNNNNTGMIPGRDGDTKFKSLTAAVGE